MEIAHMVEFVVTGLIGLLVTALGFMIRHEMQNNAIALATINKKLDDLLKSDQGHDKDIALINAELIRVNARLQLLEGKKGRHG